MNLLNQIVRGFAGPSVQLPEECCNCHSIEFQVMPDGQRRCKCGLRWRVQEEDRPGIKIVRGEK